MNKLVINILGGPGIGKTTTAHQLTGYLKADGYSAEFVGEFAKEIIYYGDWNDVEDPLYLLAVQNHRMRKVLEVNDIVVTDTSLLNNIIYFEPNNCRKLYKPESFFPLVYNVFNSYKNMGVVLERSNYNYNNEGRVHDLTEAMMIDQLTREVIGDGSIFSWPLITERVGEYHINRIYDQIECWLMGLDINGY